MIVLTYDPKNRIKPTRVDIWDNADLAENENELFLVEAYWSNGAYTSEGLPNYDAACEYANKLAKKGGIDRVFK